MWFVLIFLIGFPAFADIDLKSGNFFHSWIDGEMVQESMKFELSRFYNSRSKSVGYFGSGFCSKIEARLTELKSGDIEIQNCGAGEKTLYNRKPNGWVYFDQVLQKKGDLWILKESGITKLQFRHDGKLDAFWLKNEKVQIEYISPSEIRLIMGKVSWALKIENGLVTNITSNGKKIITYSYQGKNLREVNNFWGNKYAYLYEKTGKMRAAIWPDGGRIEIEYAHPQEWVKKIKARNECEEVYDHKVRYVQDKTIQTVDQKRFCANRLVKVATIESTFAEERRLVKLKKVSEKFWEETIFNKLGLPESMSNSNGEVFHFQYTEDGKLKKRQFGSEFIDFAWNKKNQVELVREPKSELSLRYDDRGRVVNMLFRDGQIKYDLKMEYHDSSHVVKKAELKDWGMILYSPNGRVLSKKVNQSKNIESEKLEPRVNWLFLILASKTDLPSLGGMIE